MSNRTPTPYRLEKLRAPNGSNYYRVFGTDDAPIVQVFGQPSNDYHAAGQAAFIVTACNAYNAHVARIAELEAALRKLTIAAANVCVQTDGIGVINKVAELRPLIPEMRAALAKGEAC